MKKRKVKETKSLKRRILIFILVCWIVPTAVFFAFTTWSYQDSIVNKTEGVIEDQLDNVLSYASIRLDDAIEACQKPSYEKTWEKSWDDYQNEEITRDDFVQNIYNSMKSRYYTDERFDLYAFYMEGENDKPAFLSSRAGRSYSNYIEQVHNDVKKVIELDSSYTYVKIIDGRLFVIRNLYTTDDYVKFGTMVMELEKKAVFADIPMDMRNNLMVCMDEPGNVIEFTPSTDEGVREMVDKVRGNYDSSISGVMTMEENRAYNVYLLQKRYDNYHIGVVYWAKRSEIYANLYRIYIVATCMFILFIPIVAYAVHFLKKQIQNPITQLIEASKQMEEGKIGIEVQGPPMPNQEFNYLKRSFDSMSLQLKSLFKYVYDEKMARKDAQIQALQAQINPHFLNNTLEMMNWQARMSGDVVVSKMIESLSTVLDYRMNRANVQKIHLAEELQCTDAYFYIMSMRFGQRLQIEKEIDQDLLYILVPPLILQPIVENAIVHGVETRKNGTIRMKIYHDEDKVYFKVYNSGKPLTKEDMERIQALLANEEYLLPKYKDRHTSIGIRNVNQRIKLVYGEEYGLDITRDEEDWTVSTITIPYYENIDTLGESDNEIDRVEEELKELQKTKKDKWQE